MAVRLRMAVHGVRNSRIFHLVAVNQRQRRNAKPIELLGVYNPRLKPGESTKTIEWSVQRIQYWLNVGATPSKTVTKLLQMVRVSCCRYMSAVAHDDHRAAFSHPNARCRKPCPLLRHHHQRPSHSPLRSSVPYDYLHMSIHIAQEAPDVTYAPTPTCLVSDASTRREWAEGAEAEERDEDVELRRCILCTREQGCNISMSCNFCQLLRREIVRVLRQESVTRDLLYAS